MAKTQNTDSTKWWQRGGARGTLISCCGNAKMEQRPWKTAWSFLTQLNVLLPYAPAIMLLGIIQRS